MKPRPLERREASEYLWTTHALRRSPGYLAKLASVGGGPVYKRANHITLYDVDALNAYAASITSKPAASYAEHTARSQAKKKRTAACPAANTR